MEESRGGPAAKRYSRVMGIGSFAAIFIGGIIAIPLHMSPFITMGALALILILLTLRLARAALRERKPPRESD